MFRGVLQATIGINLPRYQLSSRKDKRPPYRISERQVYQPIERFEAMPLGRRECWLYNF